MNASCINEVCTAASWVITVQLCLVMAVDFDHQATVAPCRGEVALMKGETF